MAGGRAHRALRLRPGSARHDPDRPRKLLLHAAEIEELGARVAQERLALVPLAIYFKDGRAKVELALARGRRKGDKRQAMAERDAEREAARPRPPAQRHGLRERPLRPLPPDRRQGRRPDRDARGLAAIRMATDDGPVAWSSNVNGADRFRHQFRWPSVRPELLRLVKRGTTTIAKRSSSLSPPDLR